MHLNKAETADVQPCLPGSGELDTLLNTPVYLIRYHGSRCITHFTDQLLCFLKNKWCQESEVLVGKFFFWSHKQTWCNRSRRTAAAWPNAAAAAVSAQGRAARSGLTYLCLSVYLFHMKARAKVQLFLFHPTRAGTARAGS